VSAAGLCWTRPRRSPHGEIEITAHVHSDAAEGHSKAHGVRGTNGALRSQIHDEAAPKGESSLRSEVLDPWEAVLTV
jgi:hypothetical protein